MHIFFPAYKLYIIFPEDFSQSTDRQKKQKQADYEQNLYRLLLSSHRSLSKTNFLKSLLITDAIQQKKTGHETPVSIVSHSRLPDLSP